MSKQRHRRKHFSLLSYPDGLSLKQYMSRISTLTMLLIENWRSNCSIGGLLDERLLTLCVVYLHRGFGGCERQVQSNLLEENVCG